MASGDREASSPILNLTPRKLSCILQELDQSDLEEIDDDDEKEHFANQVSREIDGNWSDNTDIDPDYVPESEEAFKKQKRKSTSSTEEQPGMSKNKKLKKEKPVNSQWT
ncbi:uncharacterized protein LOC111057400 [Nilaparvata lugens]|uniref:uncharacterized protein LOC111057400 n=1 Tax=Nilaparvata lugens TaxID=108931 RepID=UPI00193E67DE|nr:uncharacterized protein LOC111057400 [Nilaparvata lugens]